MLIGLLMGETAPAASIRKFSPASCKPSAMQPDSGTSSPRRRARELGVRIGRLPPGEFNAITDVPGVGVGQVTLIAGDSVRTGVTAILPHGGNVFAQKVPAGVFVANGFG